MAYSHAFPAGGQQLSVSLRNASQELRARKELLLMSLSRTSGVITKEIYTIMEELALVNPSGGCGSGGDAGRAHYTAMLGGECAK